MKNSDNLDAKQLIEVPLISSTSDNDLKANRPEPIVSNIDVFPYKRRTEPQDAINALTEGYSVVIVDYYSSGLSLLNALKQYVKTEYSGQSFQEQRNFRSAYRKLSHRILLKVSNYKLTVRKAPEIGWFKILYPGLNEFLLSLPQVQGLNSSWQWYQQGILIPIIKRKIHPWFETYFPTRFEHLELFDNWLKKYKGAKESAFDIGIGSGVLSFQLLKNGFEKVYGTDSNPNAIIGLNEDLNKNKLHKRIDLFYGDLFAGCNKKAELIVFNPPLLPSSQHLEGLDKAVYYNSELFPRFFAEAKNHLKPNGKIVLIFSNLAQVTNISATHPIEAELTNGGRFDKELFLQKKVRSASKNTRRDQNWRSIEKVELWVLKLRNINIILTPI